MTRTSTCILASVLRMEEDGNAARVRAIQGKLLGFQTGVELKKTTRTEKLAAKFRAVEEQISKVQIDKETKTKRVDPTLNKLDDAIGATCVAREILVERKTKELQLVESSVSLDFNLEKQELLDYDAALVPKIDRSFLALRQETAKHRRIREEIEQRHAREIAEEVARLQDKVDSERKTREENLAKIKANLAAEVKKADDAIAAATSKRESTAGELLTLLEDMHRNLTHDVEAETAMRGGIEDNLLTLIEEAATNIDKTLDQQMQEEVA